MLEAAGGADQIREVSGEHRIYPKSEKHFRQMQEVYAPAVRANQEAAEVLRGGWQTERFKMPNGETRELPAGSGEANPSLRPATRHKGKRISAIINGKYVRYA